MAHTPQTASSRHRYYVYSDYWSGGSSPIFFYVGNEADVGLYVNATGLMWENAPSFGMVPPVRTARSHAARPMHLRVRPRCISGVR
jgi:lysosomal Pro-X carboxypeptidase